MLNKVLKFMRPPSDGVRNKVGASHGPEGVRLYAVGDIHGRLDLLEKLLDRIATEESDLPKKLIFLGDYVDRGAHSRGVIDRLIGLTTKSEAHVFLKGNHEAAMLNFMEAPDENESWLEWGGMETLESYGVNAPASKTADYLASELKNNIPPTHLAFLEGLELSYAAGDYFFAHAGVKPGRTLDEQEEEDLLWIRREFHRCPKDQRPDKVIVHGHHPEDRPVDTNWRIGVDTGAVWSGVLTAVVLEGTNRRFITAKSS